MEVQRLRSPPRLSISLSRSIALHDTIVTIGVSLAVGVGVCRLLPEFNGLVRLTLVVALTGIAGYLVFLMTIDIPMYLNRWRAGLVAGRKLLGLLEGMRDATTRWVVTHDFAQWKDEIAWMSLYFTAAVWASLALCLVYSLGNYLPR
jgi:hypothetical protein